MERLEPIPSPTSHLIREFCHRFLPVVIFAGALGATALLWRERFTGTMVNGEVEPIRANVTTLEGGTLSQLFVTPFQSVTNGQEIAVVDVIEPSAVIGDLSVLRTELAVMRSRMALDEARNEQNVEALRAQWLEARVDLATARVNLDNAKREVERLNSLREGRIVSDAEFENAETLRDSFIAEVQERTEQVAGLGKAVAHLSELNQRDRGGALDVVTESLEAQEKRLNQQRRTTLRSPIDGIVKFIHHRAGERIPAGAIVAVIGSPHSERIVGVVREPLSFQPEAGMDVEIRTRGPLRQSARSRVLGVDADLDAVIIPLRFRGFENSLDRGLAFYVALPSELKVHPGEVVDIVFRR